LAACACNNCIYTDETSRTAELTVIGNIWIFKLPIDTVLRTDSFSWNQIVNDSWIGRICNVTASTALTIRRAPADSTCRIANITYWDIGIDITTSWANETATSRWFKKVHLSSQRKVRARCAVFTWLNASLAVNITGLAWRSYDISILWSITRSTSSILQFVKLNPIDCSTDYAARRRVAYWAAIAGRVANVTLSPCT